MQSLHRKFGIVKVLLFLLRYRREFFKMEKAERGSDKRRERGREGGEGEELSNCLQQRKSGSVKEFQSGRHSGCWVIYSTERLVG